MRELVRDVLIAVALVAAIVLVVLFAGGDHSFIYGAF